MQEKKEEGRRLLPREGGAVTVRGAAIEPLEPPPGCCSNMVGMINNFSIQYNLTAASVAGPLMADDGAFPEPGWAKNVLLGLVFAGAVVGMAGLGCASPAAAALGQAPVCQPPPSQLPWRCHWPQARDGGDAQFHRPRRTGVGAAVDRGRHLCLCRRVRRSLHARTRNRRHVSAFSRYGGGCAAPQPPTLAAAAG